MPQAPSGVSVVVPTRGRSHLVERLLISLSVAGAGFEYPAEVLIVDDSSSTEEQKIKDLCLAHGARYLRGKSSVRQKRNLGIQEARYSVVLFVDSDCEAMPGLFREHYGSYPPDDPLTAGVVGLTEFVGKDSWMWDVVQRTPFLNAFSFAQRMAFPPWATCSNTSYLKSALEQIHGFEENWPNRLGAEDVDLGLRLAKAGFRLRSNPAALVLHTRETWSRFGDVWQRAFLWGRMDVHVYYRRHKDKVSFLLPAPRHLFVLLCVASVVQAVLTGVPWLLLSPIAWLLLVLFLRAALTLWHDAKPVGELGTELIADVLGLGVELGTLSESIIRWEPSCFYKSVQRGPVLPVFAQQEHVVQAWAMWLGWIVIGLIQLAVLR